MQTGQKERLDSCHVRKSYGEAYNAHLNGIVNVWELIPLLRIQTSILEKTISWLDFVTTK